ncbi:MAG: tetratricopeptide repeat protein, partial [Salinivirgaceae bacterium]|nr:tetratricopeptide repeat protein [Salinivirgaceae bacterium]
MKKILLISIILNISTLLMAANDTIPKEIYGVERVSYYNEHARQILDTDPEKSRELAIAAMNLAEALNDYEGLSNALNYIGLTFYNQENYGDAIKHFQQSLRVSLRLGARDRVGNIFQKIGMSYLHLKDYQKAIFYYEQTAKVFEQLDYSDHLAKTQFELGVVYFLAHEYSNAINALSNSVENYAKIENLRGKAQAYNQLGMTYEAMGNLRKSLTFFQQALEVHHTFSNRDHLAFVLNNMGRIYTKLKMLNEADDVLENAVKYCSSSYVGLFAEIKLNQGIVAYKRNNYNMSETLYNQAHQI